jgi:malonyl-CoA O-methyltransferase
MRIQFPDGLMTKMSQSIENGFSRAARHYDAWARSQYRAAERLVSMLPEGSVSGRVVDLGCGTGAVIDALLKRPADERPFLIEGVDISAKMIDAASARFIDRTKVRFHQSEMTAFLEHPPSDDIGNGGGYDAILSNFAAQWVESPQRLCVLSHLNLKRNGMLAICVPVEGSLPELHDAIAQTGRTLHTVFRPALEWRNAVSEAGFQITQWEEDDLVESYPTGRDALASVHRIGAARALHAGRSRLSVAQMRRVMRSLESATSRNPQSANENAASERGVTMTYRAIWCVAANRS